MSANLAPLVLTVDQQIVWDQGVEEARVMGMDFVDWLNMGTDAEEELFNEALFYPKTRPMTPRARTPSSRTTRTRARSTTTAARGFWRWRRR